MNKTCRRSKLLSKTYSFIDTLYALLKSPTFYFSGGVSRCRNVDVCVLAINFSLGTVNCTSHHQEVPTWHNWFVVNACLCRWVCKITVLALSQGEALFKDLQLFQTGS